MEGGQAMTQEVSRTEQRLPQTTETAQSTTPRPLFVPPADIYETRDNIVVLAEMPSVAPDGVDITLERRVLTICGRSAVTEHSGYQRVYTEYTDGDYERSFTLSENIDRDRIEATLRNGVLHLVLPKAETAKARRIELKTG
jgi:HSP20 family protein